MNNISFITNAGENNLEYLKLLMKSLRENLHYKFHEIIVFIDRDNEGMYNYLKDIKKDFFDLKIVTHKFQTKYVGYQLNINILVDLAKYDIVSYIQSDMIISKNYDLNVLESLEDNCILSSTRIEPPLHPASSITFTKNFGLHPSEFKWDDFIEYSESVKSDKEVPYFFAPFTFYKKYWQLVGGHDSIFRRSREDSDILQRFLYSNVKIKQTFRANVYHFTCVSSRGNNWFDENNVDAKNKAELQKIADLNELKKFIRKWGGFSHGTEMLVKYDIELKINNSKFFDINFIKNIEPYFTKVWLDDDDIRNNIINSLINYEDELCNKLCNINNEDWNKTKKYYNLTDYNSIFNFGDPINYKCLITINRESNMDSFIEIINKIKDLMNNYDTGEYEYNGIQIIINSKNKISDLNLIVSNPTLDSNLIIIE